MHWSWWIGWHSNTQSSTLSTADVGIIWCLTGAIRPATTEVQFSLQSSVADPVGEQTVDQRALVTCWKKIKNFDSRNKGTYVWTYVIVIGRLIAPRCTSPLVYMHHRCSHLSAWVGRAQCNSGAGLWWTPDVCSKLSHYLLNYLVPSGGELAAPVTLCLICQRIMSAVWWPSSSPWFPPLICAVL